MMLSIQREAAISFGINAALSLGFFLAVFEVVDRPLGCPRPMRWSWISCRRALRFR